MADYSVVASDGSGSLGTFDAYKPALSLYKKLEKKRSVGLVCLHDCGCLYRAIFKAPARTFVLGLGTIEPKRTHSGWRRAEACALHKRSPPMKKKGQTERTALPISADTSPKT